MTEKMEKKTLNSIQLTACSSTTSPTSNGNCFLVFIYSEEVLRFKSKSISNLNGVSACLFLK